MQKNAFYIHLKEAIDTNQGRKKIYAQQTHRQSVRLSNLLIMSEKISLPVARYFDWKARRFNQAGIGVVANDFVPMDDILPPETPPLYPQQASPAHLHEATQLTQALAQKLKATLKTYNFEAACAATEDALQQLAQIEHRAQAHFAMLKHLLESIGYASVNAPQYAQLSKGATGKLSRQLIGMQAKGLSLALRIDTRAQKIHQLGAGIIVNDVPPIPFLERLREQF
ncbi:hypothetical protein [Microscilla marina]|uniref:Uncharacterized protein n=1 Tax=Microscilla marina ATCC 23134 TaxID=313606 RepID=A1ZCV3_MICM2|nr:hypothetical protein [Microscilla marina]EAY31492.1 hypothetical protein M23134_04998 [Microscilla marina ATCC 23134]